MLASADGSVAVYELFGFELRAHGGATNRRNSVTPTAGCNSIGYQTQSAQPCLSQYIGNSVLKVKVGKVLAIPLSIFPFKSNGDNTIDIGKIAVTLYRQYSIFQY